MKRLEKVLEEKDRNVPRSHESVEDFEQRSDDEREEDDYQEPHYHADYYNEEEDEEESSHAPDVVLPAVSGMVLLAWITFFVRL